MPDEPQDMTTAEPENTQPQAPVEPEPKTNLDDDPLDEFFIGNGEDISDQAFAEAMGADTVGGEDEVDEEAPEGEAPAEAKHEEEEEDEGDLVETPAKRLESLLDRLEAKAREDAGEDAMEAPTEEAAAAEQEEQAEAPKQFQNPYSTPDMKLSEDEHYEVMSDADTFNEYIERVQARTVESMLQQMQPMMLNAAIQAQGAMQFEKDIFARFPALKTRPNIINKALIEAQRKEPAAGYEKWFEMTVEALADVEAVQRALHKHGKARDVRGGNRHRNAPAGRKRSGRDYNGSSKNLDDTSQALEEIARIGNTSGAALISELGLD